MDEYNNRVSINLQPGLLSDSEEITGMPSVQYAPRIP